jgi:hypothetical protein
MPNTKRADGKTYKPFITVGIGTAGLDLSRTSKILQVIPVENRSQAEEKDQIATESKNQVSSEAGEAESGSNATAQQGETKTANYYEAEYIDLVSNRVYPPDIRKGEQVLLINIADSDKRYWYPLGRDDNLRKCERYRIAVSDDVRPNKDLHDDNTWFLEFDTLEAKTFTISTSKSDTENPEEYRYKIQIDAGKDKNFIVISDDAENEIKLESKEPRIYLRNRDKSIVDINKKNIILSCPEDIVLRAGRQIVQSTPVKTENTVEKDSTTVLEAKSLTLKAENTITLDAPSIGFNGVIIAPKALNTGPIVAEGYATAKAPPAYENAKTEIKDGTGNGAGDKSTPQRVTGRSDPWPKFDDGPGAASAGFSLQNHVRALRNQLNAVGAAAGGGEGGGGLNTPLPPQDTSGNRKCAAWEDMVKTVDLICADLLKIDGIIGYGEATGGIKSACQAAAMNKNTGE